MKLKVPRGSYERIKVIFRTATGGVYDLTDHVCHLVVGKRSDGTEEMFRLRSSEVAEALVDIPTGVIWFYCSEVRTETYPQADYWYDIWVRYPDGRLRQWPGAIGRFEVGPRVRDEVGIPAP